MSLTKLLRRIKNGRGASLVEYGLLVGLIALLVIFAIMAFGVEVKKLYQVDLDIASSGGSTPEEEYTELSCYDPINIGSVGEVGWIGCEGMLIVDNAMLSSFGSSMMGGSGSFAITVDGVNYTYGESENRIFTGQVTSIDVVFAYSSFNEDIGYWDTSNVTSMETAFYMANDFNQDIGGWDTSNVTNMSGIFGEAFSFNQDVGGWNVGLVENMDQAFGGAAVFNQNIGQWDTGNVVNMSYMFSGAASFDQNIGGWDTSGVTDMRYMFGWEHGADTLSFSQDLSGWCVSSVTSPAEDFFYPAAVPSFVAHPERLPRFGEVASSCP